MKHIASKKGVRPSSPRRFLKEAGFFLLDILYNAVVIIALVVLIRSFLISPFRVIGSSMADTLASNEFILIDKLSYQLGEPRRGDPVVFRPPITDKYAYKFEEVVMTDAEGKGILDLAPLSTTRPVIYCQNRLMTAFWFCREGVTSGDLLFWHPEDDPSEETFGDLAWQNALERRVTPEEAEAQRLELEGSPNRAYRLRIYDSAGPEYFVKRIVGVPGDEITIENGRVYLKTPSDDSFLELREPYLNSENLNHTYFSSSFPGDSFLIPEGHYFVLGDNRNHSNDSRGWLTPISRAHTPFVSSENISGKVLVVLWPLQNVRLIPGALLE